MKIRWKTVEIFRISTNIWFIANIPMVWYIAFHMNTTMMFILQKQPTSYFCQKGVLFFSRSDYFYDIYRTPTKFPGGIKVKRTAQVI